MQFSEEEFKSAIIKCNNSLTLGPDKLFWNHLKVIVNNILCLKKFISIADACINLGHWPLHFKLSPFIIIPKSNKALYDSPKSFRPIVLLNMLGKLIEKVIGERLQFQMISKNVIHPCQLGSLKQCSTMNAGVVLTHLIYARWIKHFLTSILMFDIAQFFPSFNH